MKLNISKAMYCLVLSAAIAILPACSSASKKQFEVNGAVNNDQQGLLESLAGDVGKLEVGDSLISEASNGVNSREYSVVGAYIAASGRDCREIESTELDGNLETDTSIVCRTNAGNWYWPRKIILK